jgi:type II secretory pathway pseudopilin PulG
MRAGRTLSAQKPNPQSGFTLLAVLVAMVLLALASQQVITVLAQQAQREREAQLIWVGEAFRQAIGAYYENSPGTVKRWPRELNDLVEDRRFVTLRRHVRKIYADPITRNGEWGIIRSSDGGVQGIYSLSDLQSIRTVSPDGQTLASGSIYRDWRFVYEPLSSAKGK